MSPRRLLLATVVPAALAVGPVPGTAANPLLVHDDAYIVRSSTVMSGACVAVAVGDVAAVVITECTVDLFLAIRSPVVAFGPVGIATFTGVQPGDGQVCWAGYVIPMTEPEATIPFWGCL